MAPELSSSLGLLDGRDRMRVFDETMMLHNQPHAIDAPNVDLENDVLNLTVHYAY